MPAPDAFLPDTPGRRVRVARARPRIARLRQIRRLVDPRGVILFAAPPEVGGVAGRRDATDRPHTWPGTA